MADIGFSSISDIFSSLTGKGDITLSYKNLSALFGKLASDDPIAYPERWGAGSSSSPKQNQTAFRKAYNYLVQQGGGTIQFRSYGPYDFGTLDIDDFGLRSGINVGIDNIRVKGCDNKHGSRIDFSSALFTTGVPSGAWIYVDVTSTGFPQVNVIDNFCVENLTIRDYNTGPYIGATLGPGMISGIRLRNATLRHLKLLNGRGNSAIVLVGNASSNVIPGDGLIYVEDIWCFAEDRAHGLFQEGDWLNFGGFGRLYMTGIHIPKGGMDRNAIEMGSAQGDYILNDIHVDMNSEGVVGGCCIGSVTSIGSFQLTNSTLRNWSSAGFGISLTPDLTTNPINNISIKNVNFKCSNGNACLVVGGDVTDTMQVEGCLFDSIAPIYLNTNTIPKRLLSINNNKTPLATHLIVTNGNGGLNLGPDFQDTTTIFEAKNNIIGGFSLGFPNYVIDLTLNPHIKNSRQFKPGIDNIFCPGTESNGQIDGHNFVVLTLAALVANGADSPLFTTTILGARIGDIVHIRSHSNVPVPAGVRMVGDVTSDNTITYYGHNNSGGNWAAGVYSLLFNVERK